MPHIVVKNIDDLMKSLEEASTALIEWFDNHLLKSNPDKCHLLISSNKNLGVKIGKYEIENSECKKF